MNLRIPYFPTGRASKGTAGVVTAGAGSAGVVLALVVSVFLWVGAANAQTSAERVVSAWLGEQRAAMTGLERVTLRADMELSLSSGQTTRNIDSRTLLTFVPGENPDRTLESLRVDGRLLPPESGDRFDERMRDLLGDGPEGQALIGSHAAGALLPAQLIRNLQLAPPVNERDRDGETFLVVTGRLDPPGDGPGMRPGDRPGAQRPGARPGGPPGRAQGRRGPPPPLSATPPRHEVTLWFATDSHQLTFMEHRIAMPRGQGLIIRTRFARMYNLDLPISRTVEGDIPSIRRLRTVTLQLDQRLTFLDHDLIFAE